jgi:methionyl-tRNA formyltransferase
MRVVFMGTPEFAVPPLLALVNAGHDVAAVFTQPDKPQGRKMLLVPPPVKKAARKAGIPVFQPTSLKSTAEAERIAALKPDVIAVAAYRKILPKAILDIPQYGCINVHASLLPKYRGASPVQAAILNGDAETGVTTMMMGEACDEGDILFERATPIGPEETTPELTERLSHFGADLLIRTLAAVKNGTVMPQKQDGSRATYVSLISKKMSPIDWNRPAQEIHNQVRGLYPWPAASAVVSGHRIKIYRSRLAAEESGEPGFIFPQRDGFAVCCGGGTVLELLEVQAEGGRRMSGREFLCGHAVRGLKMA